MAERACQPPKCTMQSLCKPSSKTGSCCHPLMFMPEHPKGTQTLQGPPPIYILSELSIHRVSKANAFSSSLKLRGMRGTLSPVMTPKISRYACIRVGDSQEELLDAIRCPEDQIKLSESLLASSCSASGAQCPEGARCTCKPCRIGDEFEVGIPSPTHMLNPAY